MNKWIDEQSGKGKTVACLNACKTEEKLNAQKKPSIWYEWVKILNGVVLLNNTSTEHFIRHLN